MGGVFDQLRAKAAAAMNKAVSPSASGSLVDVTFADVAPSWDALAARVAERKTELGMPLEVDLENGPTNPHALIRRFGTTAEPRVLFYRDHAAWCPYCQKIWMQLEEKRIPYRVEKINMRCYGDKKKSFTDKVPSGMLPVVEIDGVLMTESAAIATALEEKFPHNKPLLPPSGTPERRRADDLCRLERALFSRWMGWLTQGWMDGQNRSNFEEALDAVDAELAASPGPYFMGEELTLVDVTYAPFLERMAASLCYYKGFKMEGTGGRWPAVDAWYAAMASREDTYARIKSDYYTHCHDLPPQLGGCEANGDDAQTAARDEIDGGGWRLPLPPLDADALEPSWRGERPEMDRVEAAAKLVGNHDAVTRFAARGCGKAGARPVAAPLSDPTAVPGEAHLPAVDAALRRVALELLDGTAHKDGVGGDAGTGAKDAARTHAAGPAADSLAYLRDRVGVPRDLPLPAARQLRAHLNWYIDRLAEA